MSEKPEDREQKTTDAGQSPQTASRLILLIAIVIAVCVFIIRNFDVSKHILLVMLGFGAVVLIHEFGHFVVAIAFIGALRDPLRNRWLFDFGLMACALVIPYALAFGGLRGIPIWWRLMDGSFGVFGFIPLWFCRQWTAELEQCVKN